MQFLKTGSLQDGDDGAPPIPRRLDYTPPSALGKLLLLSLFVMLSTPLCMTILTGIDQYSLFSLELSCSVPTLTLLVVLSLIINAISVLLAYQVYCFIWQPGTSWVRFVWGPIMVLIRFFLQREENPAETKQNPFTQFAVAVGVPVTIAMLPSILLVNTYTKPYFVIVGLLIAIGLSISGALTHPDVKLDPGVVTLWYGTAAGGVIVLMGLAVAVTIYFQIAEPTPPTGNSIWSWGDKWAPLGSQEDDDVPRTPGSNPGSTPQELRYWPDDYERRQLEGNLLFGLTSIAYMVTVLGGYLLYSISVFARKIPVQASTPDKQVAQLDHGGDVLIDNRESGSDQEVNEQDATEVLREEIPRRVINSIPEGDEKNQLQGETQPNAQSFVTLKEEALHGEQENTLKDAAHVTTTPSLGTNEEVPKGDEDDQLDELTLSDWGKYVLKQIKQYSDDGPKTYVLHIGFEHQEITDREYEYLNDNVEEGRKATTSKEGVITEEVRPALSGPLRHTKLFVHKPMGVAIHKTENDFCQPPLQKNSTPFRVLCILAAAKPDQTFSTKELKNLLKKEGHTPPDNLSHVTAKLREYYLPVERKNRGIVYIERETKVCFLDSL